MDVARAPLPLLRSSFAVLLWLLALTVVVGVLLGDRDPLALDAVVATLTRILRATAFASLGVGIVAVLFWPPFLPGLRLWLRRSKDRMSVDQRPLHEANARLKHFENAADHLTAGRTWLRMGAFRQALPHLVRSVELDGDSAQGRYQLGLALFGIGQLEAACQQLGRAVAIDPSHAFGDALLVHGLALERGGKGEAAEAALAQHEARFGASRRADLARARIALQRGDAAAAARLLARASRPPEGGMKLPPEEALARAKARVLRLRSGVGA